MNSMVSRVFNKVVSCVCKSGPLYRIAMFYARRAFNALPLPEAARCLLQAVSPAPEGGLKVAPRKWPEVPMVDVSVIVPCYNVERFIGECVQSIVSQSTSRTFEVICIDDGATDGTGAILDGIAAAEGSVRVVHQPNAGFSGARNRGIAEAFGKCLIFVDADDRMLPGAIEKLCDAYDEGGCDFVTASYENLSEDGKSVTPLNAKRDHGAPWGRLYSREIWRDLVFPEGFWFEDTVQSFCIDPRWRERYIDVPVYLYRNNGEGITNTAARSKKGLDSLWIVGELLEWNKQLGIPFDQGMYDRVIWQLGTILWGRISALSEEEHVAAFVYGCDMLEECDPDRRFVTTKGGRWSDLERGLRTRNYRVWKTAVLGLL